MGTEITLDVAGISIDYSKNHMGNDHGHLFDDGDVTRREGDGINYDYYKENPEDQGLEAHEAALCRPLGRVVPRLNMLGHTLDTAREEYEAMIAENVRFETDDSDSAPDFMSFQEFCEFACRRPLTSLDQIANHDVDDEVHKANFPDDPAKLKRLPFHENDMFWSEASYYGTTCCFLSPYSMLQIFATRPDNSEAEVMWQFGPIVEAGWVSRESFQAGARRRETTLIATEGSSDARILSRALELLRPDVLDFFRFVDVNESHPFSGTGNLRKFAEGLVRIDVQNQVIVLLDNDAEGVDAFRKMLTLPMPPNMTATLLPEHPSLRAVPARGPEGTALSDINGRAAAIECYLDLNLPHQPPAQVLWSNYKKDIDAWQGALEYKETYTDRFLKLIPETSAGYDFNKLEAVLDHLIGVAVELARRNER